MNLDEAQKTKVRSWLEQGLKLSEIQNKISADLGLKLTYMEVRFLLDDLKLKPKDVEPPKAPPAPADLKTKTPPPKADAKLQPPVEEEPVPGQGNVSVAVDQITRSGALVSGKVTFSDGKSADWYLDQMGRLGVAPQEKGYKPSQADVMAFQAELQNELARLGY